MKTGQEPLVAQRGSPRPAGRDALSREIFPTARPQDWNPDRWAAWFATAAHAAEGATETLLERGCPAPRLYSILLRAYVLPTAPAPTRADIARMRRTIKAARAALQRLERSPFGWLDELSLPPDLLSDLGAVDFSLADLHGRLRGAKTERFVETTACAWLVTVVYTHTRKWHDAEIADLLDVFWGHRASDGAAAAQAEWRRRNHAIVDLHRQLYRHGHRWDAQAVSELSDDNDAAPDGAEFPQDEP